MGIANCLPGEEGVGPGTASSQPVESASASCALCGGRSDVGGDGDRLEGLSRSQSAAAAEEALRAEGGEAFTIHEVTAALLGREQGPGYSAPSRGR
eukprot:g18610.t1